jgi:putative transposase
MPKKESERELRARIRDLERKLERLRDLLAIAGLGKSTCLYCVKHPDPDAKNAGVIGRIKAIFDGSKGRYGVRRAAAVLRSEGAAISNRKVNRLMQKLGLRPCCPRKKYRSYKGGEGLIGDGAKNWIHIRSRAK